MTPYNTRRKSLSLPSLGIHIPMTHAARAALSARTSSSARSVSTSSSTVSTPSSTMTASPDSSENQPSSKRVKRSHSDSPSADSAIEQSTITPPPPSPTHAVAAARSLPTSPPKKIDLEGINDDIVEGVITQLETTNNRPHLVKELALVLGLKLSSVQHSANPCAIISSRLASYLKRPCWSAASPCPLAKELETVHPRRTYYFLTTYQRQELPTETLTIQDVQASIMTPSVSLTDDSGSSDDIELRRRDLSPSPEVDLIAPEFDDFDDDLGLPITPVGSFKHHYTFRDPRRESPPLEKDEREFTQTADILQKRKLSDRLAVQEPVERPAEPVNRDDSWFSDSRSTFFMTSPVLKPLNPSMKKEEDNLNWLKLNAFVEWDQGAESIEIDELDGLLDTY